MVTVAFLGAAAPSRAEPRSNEIAAGVLAQLPVGELERGSKLADLTFGLLSAEIVGARTLTERWSLLLALDYGAGVPRLCGSTSDCLHSLGREVAVRGGVRYRGHQYGRFHPQLDAAVGYEWFSSRLSDEGAVSSRSYRGLTALVAASCDLRRSGRWGLAPLLAIGAGAFHRFSLATPSFDVSRSIAGVHLHAWLSFGLRFVFDL